MTNVLTTTGANQMIDRIEKLTSNTTPNWGKMNVAQMLAHCCVTYEMLFEDKHPKPNAFMKMVLKLMVKNTVVGPKPYKKNSQTAPAFKITDEREFEKEKKRLIDYLKRTGELGKSYFNGRESHSFGVLTITEWNTMFSKHLDHHLTQFGV
jgi:hypothetical protein